MDIQAKPENIPITIIMPNDISDSIGEAEQAKKITATELSVLGKTRSQVLLYQNKEDDGKISVFGEQSLSIECFDDQMADDNEKVDIFPTLSIECFDGQMADDNEKVDIFPISDADLAPRETLSSARSIKARG